MESLLAAFGKIAPYLTHPLVLVGFVLLLAFSIHQALIKSGIITPLSQRGGSKAVQMLLRYGFWLALVVIVLGVGLRFVEIQAERDQGSSGIEAGGDVNVTAGGGSAAALQTGDGTITQGSAPGGGQSPAAPSAAADASPPAQSGIRAGGSVSVEAKEESTATLQTGSGSVQIQQEPAQ